MQGPSELGASGKLAKWDMYDDQETYMKGLIAFLKK
jgi:hypothetical protein